MQMDIGTWQADPTMLCTSGVPRNFVRGGGLNPKTTPLGTPLLCTDFNNQGTIGFRIILRFL
jgi:hypothetical protein